MGMRRMTNIAQRPNYANFALDFRLVFTHFIPDFAIIKSKKSSIFGILPQNSGILNISLQTR